MLTFLILSTIFVLVVITALFVIIGAGGLTAIIFGDLIIAVLIFAHIFRKKNR